MSENAPFNFKNNAGGSGFSGGPNASGTATAKQREKYSKTPTLDQYGRDLTGEAADGRLDPASGRERELRRVITVLGRRQKNNP
ncbi:MAG TPA: ATP-dependent Clp protease ATP-binding subunit, partial [Ktedonobacteraceae bacterium]